MGENHKTCKHPGCTCRVDESTDFCTPSCATAASGGMRDTCACGHPGCTNSASQASAEGRPATTMGKSY